MQYQKLLEILNENSMGNWSNLLKKQIPDLFKNINHGDFSKWLNVIHDLPFVSASGRGNESKTWSPRAGLSLGKALVLP